MPAESTIKFTYQRYQLAHWMANRPAHPTSSVEFTVSGDSDLSSICEEFLNFLRGLGYPVDFGDSLEIIKAEDASSCSYELEGDSIEDEEESTLVELEK